MKKFLLRKLALAFKLFLILLCLFNSAETFAQVITPPNLDILAPSTTTLSSTANPSVAGQPVIITATVTSPASGVPSGTVDFFDNTNNIDLTPGGITMSNGIATYQTSALGVNMSITAKYSGDAGNLPSTSAAFTQIVNHPIIIITPAFNTTTTTLVSNLNPSVAGSQAVTLTATVSSSGPENLTGKVVFFDNTNNKNLSPAGVALSNGVATFTTSSLDFGDLDITASYGGDANGNQPSTSNSLIQHVLLNVSGLGVTLTSSHTPSKWGELVQLTATVSTGVGISAGTVIFADGGNLLGSATVDGSGKAVLETNLLTPGSHNITASYFSITSSVLTQNVTPPFPPVPLPVGTGFSHPRVSLIDNFFYTQDFGDISLVYNLGSDYGQAATFVANVFGATGYTPTGSVTFFDGTTPLGTVGLDAAGNAVFTTSILSVGINTISVSYSGDDVYADQASINQFYSSPSPSLTLHVYPSSTTTTVSSSLNPSVSSQQITFIATVASPYPESNAIAPDGTVIFNIDGIDQDPAPLSGNGVKAFLDISSLSPGSHTIKATYTGDGNYKASSSGSITQVVGAVGSVTLNFLGASQSTLINTFFPNGLRFDIMDLNPNLAGGAAITFTAPSSGASGTFSNGTNTITVHTTALGSVGEVDSGPFKANGTAGTYIVRATIPGMGTNDFTLTNTAPTVQITIGSNVTGLSFTVDGTTYSTTQTFSWVPGSSHSMATTSPQAGLAGTQYVFTGWSDGTNTLSDNITVPSTATSYTANFKTQYQLTVAANPSNGGTVSPASAAFYNTGDVVPLTATANAGYVFSSWTGNVANTSAASTSVTMSAPQNVTANFNQLPVTVQVTVGTSVPGLSFKVDFTTYTSTQTLNWFPGDIHTISTSTTQAGAVGSQYVFTSWSNGGGAVQFVSAGASTTFTANFKTQYQLTTTSNPAPGSGGSVTPASGNFYDAGSIISLQASPDAGSFFSGFTGDLSGITNPQNLVMGGPRAVTAGFGALVTYYIDSDKDGYGSTATAMLSSSTPPVGYSTNNTDCNDADITVHAKQTYYQDADGDTYGNAAKTTSVCSLTPPLGYVINKLDCNDGNPAINPAAVEVCGNRIDDNCNGVVDEGICYACQNATNLKATSITSTSAQISWSAVANPVQWQLQYKTTRPGSKWVDVLLTGNLRIYKLSSLSSNQNYLTQIRAKCGNTWTSYSVGVGFKTLAGGGLLSLTNVEGNPALELNAEGSSTIMLHPNPTNGRFMLRLNVAGKINGKAQIQLIDITGKTVHSENAVMYNGGLQKTITVSSTLAKGVYMVRIVVNNKTYKTPLVYEK